MLRARRPESDKGTKLRTSFCSLVIRGIFLNTPGRRKQDRVNYLGQFWKTIIPQILPTVLFVLCVVRGV